MREKLESRKLVMGNTSMHAKVVEGNVKREEERLNNEIKSLLLAGTALSVATKSLQVILLIYLSQPHSDAFMDTWLSTENTKLVLVGYITLNSFLY